jgi:hypothetical protein
VDFGLARRYDPAAFVVVIFGLLGMVRATVGRLGGRRISVRLCLKRGWVVAAAMLIVVLWAQ